MTGDPLKILKLKIVLARLGLFWERLWSAAFWPAMTAGCFLLVVISGAATLLPQTAKYLFVALSATAFIYALKGFAGLKWPRLDEGLRRIEKRSKLAHRPVTSWFDRLSNTAASPQTQSLWQVHRQRQREKFTRLKAGLPHSRWMYLDPNALRVSLALLLLVAVVLQGGDIRQNFADLLRSAKAPKVAHITLDAWISPPVFTRKPPILLTGKAQARNDAAAKEIIVPEGSRLKVRVNGADNFTLELTSQPGNGRNGKLLKAIKVTGGDGAGYAEKQFVLKRPANIAVKINNAEQARWNIFLVPDTTPQITTLGPTQTTPTGGFAVNWQASDDYGIASVAGVLQRLENSKPASGQKATALAYDPPRFSVSLPRLNPKKAKGRAFQDLTAHPWAGQRVSLVLQATDQAGQTGYSKKLKFTLPQRQFSKPLARAIVEQRRRLVENPANKTGIVRLLSALLAWPDGVIEKSGWYLGLRLETAKLHRAKTTKDLKKSVDSLWKLALSIEDGDLSKARRDLEAARRALQQALRDGASRERIAELTRQLRKALDNYMAALARQMQQNAQRNKASRDGLRPGREIRPRDLQKMMDNIENLARSGARDAAQEMLSQLENILKNLNPGLAQQPMAPQRMPPAARNLEKLTDLMRRQRQLMDKTFKMPDQRNRNGRNFTRNGQRRSEQRANRPGDQLSTQQEQLKNLLGRLMQQLSKDGLPAPRGLKDARRSMRDAADALKNGQKGSALGLQGNAMRGLRRGAETMVRNMMRQGKGEQGNFGRHGKAPGEQNDPLGRPMPRKGADLGPTRDMLPKQPEILRAQDILRILRQRANDRQRPKLELDYLERLLDGLF